METQQVSLDAIVTEISISVPWGHVSGKVWGSRSAPPVLCVHGIQDNASTFDNLIPLLPSSLCYVAIDLPGHGRSSHFPPGLLYAVTEYCGAVNRIVEYFGWKKFMYIGHSLGGQVGLFYTSVYPEQVTKLVILDCIVPWEDPDDVCNRMAAKYKTLYKIEQKMRSQPPPSYSEEEALRRLTEGRPTPLTTEAAMFLFSRGVVKNGEGYSFSADQRLKLKFPWYFSKQDFHLFLDRIKCPVFFVRASDTKNAGSAIVNGDFEAQFSRNLGTNFHFKVVEGSHDVHLLYPDRFAQELFKFLLRLQSSL